MSTEYEIKLAENLVSQYFPGVHFEDFELRKIGKLLYPVVKQADELQRRKLELDSDPAEIRAQYHGMSLKQICNHVASRSETGTFSARFICQILVLIGAARSVRQAQTSLSPLLSRNFENVSRGVWKPKPEKTCSHCGYPESRCDNAEPGHPNWNPDPPRF